MLELLRYYIFIVVIAGANKQINRFTMSSPKDIALGSVLCNSISLIWHPAIYISILYHSLFLMYFFNEKYQIDIRKYRWLLDYIDNSSDQYIQMVSTFYRSYFDRLANRVGEVEERKELVTVEEYLIKLLGKLEQFLLPISAFKLYTGERLDTLYVLYWLFLLYKAALAKRTNVVRFLHWFYFFLFTAFDSKLIIYPFICSLCIVANEFFHFGFPDKLRELFGHKPTRYCKFCKDGLTNNLLEGVLIDHHLIERRTHRDCYCRYVYQCQVRYWFDTIASLFASLYMVYWLEGNVKIWLLTTIATLYYDKVKRLLPNMWVSYSNYLFVITTLFIVGGFTDPMCSYFLMLIVLCTNIYTNVVKVM